MDHALRIARKKGYDSVRREDIAKEANVATGLVTKYWGTMVQLKRAIMREAVRIEDIVIIGQGLAKRDKCATKAPLELKKKAIRALI